MPQTRHETRHAREDARQAALLRGRIGEPGSGRDRYAAAMYFFQRGYLSEKSLEAYRTCSVIDGEDPRGALAALDLLAEVDAIERTFGACHADRSRVQWPAHTHPAAPRKGETP